MTTRIVRGFALLTCYTILLLVLFASPASAQSTAFTYQGHLMDGGASANGDYDIQFTLKTALTGGATVGIPQVANPAHAVNGIFTVELNFTSSPFSSGSDRWMELAVRPAGSLDPYTVLTPRQRVTATPYAIRSSSATTAITATSATTAATATDATNLTGTLTAGNFVAGSIPDTGLSANIVRANTSNTFTSAQTIQVTGSTLGTLSSSSTLGSWLNIGNTSVGGRTWNLISTGSADPGGVGKLHIRDATVGASRMVFDTFGDVGIGTVDPLTRLHLSSEGVSPVSSALETDDLIIAGQDAVLGLYSINNGTYGSAIALKEINGDGTIANTWGLVRKSSGGGGDFLLTYGASDNYAANPTMLTMQSNGDAYFTGSLHAPAMFCGATTQQMLNLWNTNYGIGVQNNTQYFRSDGGFAWYKGGSHSNTEQSPGTGGTKLMSVDPSGNLTANNLPAVKYTSTTRDPRGNSPLEVQFGTSVILDSITVNIPSTGYLVFTATANCRYFENGENPSVYFKLEDATSPPGANLVEVSGAIRVALAEAGIIKKTEVMTLSWVEPVSPGVRTYRTGFYNVNPTSWALIYTTTLNAIFIPKSL